MIGLVVVFVTGFVSGQIALICFLNYLHKRHCALYGGEVDSAWQHEIDQMHMR